MLCLFISIIVTETSGVTELLTDAADQLYKCKYPDNFEVRLNLSGQAEVSIALKKDEAYSNRHVPTYLLSKLARREADVESLKMVYYVCGHFLLINMISLKKKVVKT